MDSSATRLSPCASTPRGDAQAASCSSAVSGTTASLFARGVSRVAALLLRLAAQGESPQRVFGHATPRGPVCAARLAGFSVTREKLTIAHNGSLQALEPASQHAAGPPQPISRSPFLLRLMALILAFSFRLFIALPFTPIRPKRPCGTCCGSSRATRRLRRC